MIATTGDTDDVGLVVSNVPNVSIQLNKIDGYMNGVANTQYWLQVHATDDAPAANAVPKKSFMILGTDGFTFSQELFGLEIGEYCTVVLSTDKGKYVATAETAHIEVDFNPSGVGSMPTVAVVGDKTTNVQALQVWNEAAGPYRLCSLDVTETGGVASFIQVFAADAKSDASLVFQASLIVGATVHFRFGVRGTEIFSQDANHTYRKGCSVAISRTSGTNDGAGQGTIYAKYFNS